MKLHFQTKRVQEFAVKHWRLLASFAGFMVCAAGVSYYLGHSFLRLERDRLLRDLKNVQAIHAQFEAQRSAELETRVRMHAELPQFKAVLEAKDEGAITDSLDDFRQLIHAEFLGLVNDADQSFGLQEHRALMPYADSARKTGKAVYGYIEDSDQLKQVIAVPVAAGPESTIVLIAGYPVGEGWLERLRDLSRSEFVAVRLGGEESETKIFLSTSGAADFLGSGDTLEAGVELFGKLGDEPQHVREAHGSFVLAASVLPTRLEQSPYRVVAIRALAPFERAASKVWNITFIGLLLAALFGGAAVYTLVRPPKSRIFEVPVPIAVNKQNHEELESLRSQIAKQNEANARLLALVKRLSKDRAA